VYLAKAFAFRIQFGSGAIYLQPSKEALPTHWIVLPKGTSFGVDAGTRDTADLGAQVDIKR
jgi:hypothetical protein